MGAAAVGGQLPFELGDGPPHLFPLGGAQRHSPSGAGGPQVLLQGGDALGEDDVAVLQHQEVLVPRQAERLGDLLPAFAGVVVVLGHQLGHRPVLGHHLHGQGVDGGDVHPLQGLLVVHQQRQVLPQRVGQGVGERGEQDPTVAGEAQQVLDPVQRHHGLAGAGSAGDLGGAGVTGFVGDAPLGGVQEDPPGAERLGEDVLQLLGAGDERDPAGGVGDRSGQVLGAAFGRRVGGTADRHDLVPHLLGGEALGQPPQHLVLVFGEELGEGLELVEVDDGADGREHVLVDAQVAQHGVRVVGEQQLGGPVGGLLEDRGELLDRLDVADLQPTGDGVDGDDPFAGPFDRLVVRQHLQQQVGAAAVVGCQDDAAPEVVDADGADPPVPGVLQRLQPQPFVGGELGLAELLELGHRLPHAPPDRLLQTLVLLEEPVGEGELRQGVLRRSWNVDDAASLYFTMTVFTVESYVFICSHHLCCPRT